jgi:deazaflavin-dependent oxidoreductase (nitroreductase family)
MTFPRVLIRFFRPVDWVAVRLAGLGSLADIEHVGRVSGAVRHTPLRAFRSGDTVVVGLNFGRESDWLRNAAAAGGCRMRLRGRWYTLGPPRIVPVRHGVRGMPWLFGLALRYVVRTAECAEFPIVDSAPVPPSGW